MKTSCKTCGKVFNLTPTRLKPNGNYCSRECHYKSGSERPNRRTGTTKTCLVCGTEFYVPNVHRTKIKHCSHKCKGIASRLPKKLCPVCGKEWQPHYGQSKQPTCSRECGHIYRRNGSQKHCEICSTPFYVPKAEAAARFCSRQCQTTWQGRNKTSHTCTVCGKGFRWSPSRSQRQERILYCSWACRDTDPERREMLVRLNAIQQKGKPTKPEIVGYGILDALGVDYLPQHVIGGKFCVDAFVPDPGTVIQFDGDYWHGHPQRFPEPDARQARRMKLDQSQDAYMAACGFSVIRIWECDLKKNPEAVRQRLRRLLALA